MTRIVVNMTPQEQCQALLEKTSKRGDCLLWQGAVNNNGLAIARIEHRIQVVSRYLKLYEVPRTDEQIANLEGLYVIPCKLYKFCLNTKHMVFKARDRSVKLWEPMPDWREVYGSAVRGLTSGC